MIGTVDRIDEVGDGVLHVRLMFPSRSSPTGEMVMDVTTCEHIGQGSFGTVYRALCDGYPRLALKISTGKSSRMREELAVLSRVCTKGNLLLPRFEFGALNKDVDLIVIGMELCVPCTLHDMLLSTRITSEMDMLFMAYQVIQAVVCVHAEGCVHRDVKLQNFVFDVDGNLKLIDFGLACSSLHPPPGDVVAGTVSFMSPEMAHNALNRDKRVSVGAAADVWSVGIVLFAIFTQRNPYPASNELSKADTVKTDQHREGSAQTASSSAVARKSNENLLKRVASAGWLWPEQCTVSHDLRQLVEDLLKKDPLERPPLEEILKRKLWSRRRRSPPVAIAVFLGLKEDSLLTPDDTPLMRAVEQRSEVVAASLMNSRMQTPENSDDDGGEHRYSERRRSVDSESKRDTGSLKVVERQDYEANGERYLHVYDVRASVRKRSKPIREIVQVIAEETARTEKSRSHARKCGTRRQTTGSTSRPGSRASSTAGFGKASNRKAATAHRSDDDGVAVAGIPEGRYMSSHRDASSNSEGGALTACEGDAPASSASRHESYDVDLVREGMSLCLLDEETEVHVGPSSSGRAPSYPQRASTERRRTDAASSLMGPRLGVRTSLSERILHNSPHEMDTAEDVVAQAPPSVAMPKDVGVKRSASTLGSRSSKPNVRPRKEDETHYDVEVAILCSGAMTDLRNEESKERKFLSRLLFVEHSWLLASFRLTLEEDCERYNGITWLSCEQAKTADHPHRFSEKKQVVGKKYQHGFYCDMCDWEFLPGGRDGKALHFWHCPCGRDLCCDCHVLYREQCTCACCDEVHPNKATLREHMAKMVNIQRDRSAATQRSVFSPKAAAIKERAGERSVKVAEASSVRATAGRATATSKRPQSKSKRETNDGTEVETLTRAKISLAAMHQRAVKGDAAATDARHREEESHGDGGVFNRTINSIPEGRWRPFDKLRSERPSRPDRAVQPEEREALLNGEWVRHFYLYPGAGEAEDPYAFVYHSQPGRTGAIFLTSEFPMHSTVFSMLERQFFVVDSVDMDQGEDVTSVTSLIKAKGHPNLTGAFHTMQEIVSYDTNMMKQRRAPGTVSVYQAPRSAYSCNGEPFLYVRWFRFSEDRTLSAFLLSSGAVQVFVKGEYELRWFDEHRKFVIRANGVCEMVDEESFALAPAINHLLYDTFDV